MGVLLVSPERMDLIEWADRVVIDLAPFGLVSRLDDATGWQEWARGLAGMTGISPFTPPTPDGFDDWREWARSFVMALS